MNMLGRAKPASAEPTEESIRRTHEYLRWVRVGVAACGACCRGEAGGCHQCAGCCFTWRSGCPAVVWALCLQRCVPWMHVRCNFDTGGLLCCREKAKGVTFFEARDGDSVRPMLDVAWAPMLGAFRWGGWGETVACLGAVVPATCLACANA